MRNVSVENVNLGTRFKFLVDIDKIIEYNKDDSAFAVKTKGRINPLANLDKIQRLNYCYYKKKSSRKKEYINTIQELIKKEYTYKAGTHYIENDDFNELMKAIIAYCKSENVIVNWSTIEGELITYENIEKFIMFLSSCDISKHKKSQHDEICEIQDYKEKYSLILAEMNGKTEIQEGTKKNRVQYRGNDIVKDLLDKKTSGWVSAWLEFYYENYLVGEDDKRRVFEKDFPSLYKSLQIIENMV